MTNGQKAGVIVVCFFIIAVSVAVLLGNKMKEDQKKIASQSKEVIGQVVGGPMVATEYGNFVYAVYVRDLNGVICLDASNCPLLSTGQLVVVRQNRMGFKDWHVFLRYAE